MPIPSHFFVSDCDGTLHDTRAADWSKHPLRRDYRRTFSHIATVAQYKATLRAGAFAWPGGYQMFLICSDGGALCFDCGRKECRNIFDSVASKSADGWRVVATDINYENNQLFCDNCSNQIPSAYGADTAAEQEESAR